MRKHLNSEELAEHYLDIAQGQPLADILNVNGSVRGNDNTIHFYSDVNTASCAELNRILRETDSKLQQSAVVMNCPGFVPVIHLRINSYGGDLFAGLSTVDVIRSLRSHVYTYVEGAAASAATLISVSGTKRFLGKNSLMLIHQLSSICQGTFEQMQDDQENNNRLMAIIKRIYKEKTKIPMKELDQILKRDIWFTSDICMQYGLVDEIF
jgi:ATP-dependent protease ClpP protease subunit